MTRRASKNIFVGMAICGMVGAVTTMRIIEKPLLFRWLISGVLICSALILLTPVVSRALKRRADKKTAQVR
ncbi:hypothetical protein [Nitrospirillum amazonense]|uniref:hypothetical protein n=1 Tax=Nitrospirillum amazonense TaxID=28077 RepID=UPI0011A225A2|nr:hypothetical protein [Nitrospirillum amazonense]MDG3442560.1 hypothetical protein [Nitrospirillum amazonense]